MYNLRRLFVILTLTGITACAVETPAVLPTPEPASTSPATPTLAPSPTPSPTPQPRYIIPPSGPEREDFPPGVNPLTGLEVQDATTLDQPAVLISISNMPVTARPQAGPGFAPWIFELFIGEGTTRFMGVFYGDFPRRVPNLPGPCEVNKNIPYPAGHWLGGRLWLDENQNGMQDAWEVGVGGVCVRLYMAGETIPQQETSTTSNGSYAFSVEEGKSYVIAFDAGPVYTFTTPNVGDDDRDSDADPTSGQTRLLTAADADSSWDAGLILSNPPAVLPTPIPEDIAPERTYVGPIRSGRLTYRDFSLMFPHSCLIFASAAGDILERLDFCEIIYGEKGATTPNTALIDVSHMRTLAQKNAVAGQAGQLFRQSL
jgi:hypothetical protein